MLISKLIIYNIKKAKLKTQEILQLIASFNSKINKEQFFYSIFKQNYEKFLVMNFNLMRIKIIKNKIFLSNKINSKIIIEDTKLI